MARENPQVIWDRLHKLFIKNDADIRSMVELGLSDPSNKNNIEELNFAIRNAKVISDKMNEALRNIEREKRRQQSRLAWFAIEN
jgi:hypothetical protein